MRRLIPPVQGLVPVWLLGHWARRTYACLLATVNSAAGGGLFAEAWFRRLSTVDGWGVGESPFPGLARSHNLSPERMRTDLGELLYTFAVISDSHVNEAEDRSASPAAPAERSRCRAI
jgi:hypothetical protein